jgi:hypothetical protein
MAGSPAASPSTAGIAPVNVLRDKARFKSTLGEIFETFTPRTDPSAPHSFIGAAYGDPLEHTTRRYIIDDILSKSRLGPQLPHAGNGRGSAGSRR